MFVCCQVAVSATGRSLVQRCPTDCGVSLCVIKKPRAWGGPSPRWAVASETKKKITSAEVTTVQVISLRSAIYRSYCLVTLSISWFHHVTVQNMHLLITQFPHSPVTSSLSGPNMFLSISLSACDIPRFTPIQNKQNYSPYTVNFTWL